MEYNLYISLQATVMIGGESIFRTCPSRACREGCFPASRLLAESAKRSCESANN